MKYKNLMFDLGGVIMDIQRDRAVEALQNIGMTNADSMLGVYGQKGAFLALEKGEITPSQFRDELRKEISATVTDQQIDDAFLRFLIGIPVDRLRQIDQLRTLGYKIYLLSNTNAIMWEKFILDEFKIDSKTINDYFDGIVTSFEAHAYKPDALIFQHAIEKFNIIPSETLFYDDSEANCHAAMKSGLGAVHVVDLNRPFLDYLK